MISRTAKLIFEGFHGYKTNFDSITKNASTRFENRQWIDLLSDVAYRLYLHKNFVDASVELINDFHKNKPPDINYWQQVYDDYLSLIAARKDIELAYTFFSSVTRKILPAFLVNEKINMSFLRNEEEENPVCRTFHLENDLKETIESILKNIPLILPYPLISQDAQLISERLQQTIISKGFTEYNKIIIAKPLFFRNKTGYIAGKLMLSEATILPFLIAMVNKEGRLQAEALICNSEEIEVVFSFTRSYFCVDSSYPSSMVAFLQSLMPLKRQAEIYNSLGFNKHGKTLLFHELHHFIKHSNEKLIIAPGIKGMVMTVFTFPSFHTVFKIIKDEFDPVKTVTRKDVLEKYRLVYKHDRYGRLADTHEYDNLILNKDCFSNELLEELRSVAPRTVKIQGDKVLIRHTFTEKKMCPLNIFINENEMEVINKVIVDFGNALKELAYANIFPGDLLTKNFGVTKDYRVVFYDYDEITFVTSCNFKKIPKPKNTEELYSVHLHYEVKPTDIFPEEFKNYLFPPGPFRDTFIKAHPDLFEVEFWENIKQQHLEGHLYEIISYDKKNYLR